MPSIYDIKPAFQAVLKPFMRHLARCGVTPNQVTLSALLLSFLGGAMLWYSQADVRVLFFMPALLFVRMALNALDGMLAREYGQSTPLGEVLNEVGDIASDTALYLPLVLFFYASPVTVMLIVLFVLLACLTEFCGVLARAMTGVRRYDGPMGKSDRALVISLLALALYACPVPVHQAGMALFLVLNVLLCVSCLNRLKGAI
jgi:CDP-diacylglycerol--glycerol-3-phosphate 3-phosphatidyltransferase